MGIINVLLIIITTLGAFLPIAIIILRRRKILSIPKQETIKDYLKIYKEKFENYQLIEMDSKIKLDETYETPSPFVILVIFLIVILAYSLKNIIRVNFLTVYLIGVIFVFGSLIVFLLTKKPTIKNIILKNSVIELYNSKAELNQYQVDNTNVKYNIHIWRYRSRVHKYIDIYFNDDKYTSKEFNIYNFESYIAFIIFINLLKTNELEKINNLNDDDIKRLQQNFIYNQELEY